MLLEGGVFENTVIMMFQTLFAKVGDAVKVQAVHKKCGRQFVRDSDKTVIIRYVRKRETFVIAVDDKKEGWSATCEETCDNVGELIHACPSHFPYDDPSKILQWIGENLVIVEDSDEGNNSFRCYLDVPKQQILADLDISYEALVGDMQFSFLFNAVAEVHCDGGKRMENAANVINSFAKKCIRKKEKTHALEQLNTVEAQKPVHSHIGIGAEKFTLQNRATAPTEDEQVLQEYSSNFEGIKTAGDTRMQADQSNILKSTTYSKTGADQRGKNENKKQTLIETWRLYEAMIRDRDKGKKRRAKTWDKFWQKFCRPELTEDTRVSLKAYMSWYYQSAAEEAGLPVPSHSSIYSITKETSLYREKKDSVESLEYQDNITNKKKYRKKKRKKKLKKSISASTLLPKISPVSSSNRKYVKFQSEEVTRMHKKLNRHKRRELDDQFRDTMFGCRQWDARLDNLLAKYHLSKFAENDSAKFGRCTW